MSYKLINNLDKALGERRPPWSHPELSGCITTLTVRNTGGLQTFVQQWTLIDQDALAEADHYPHNALSINQPFL